MFDKLRKYRKIWEIFLFINVFIIFESLIDFKFYISFFILNDSHILIPNIYIIPYPELYYRIKIVCDWII